ncbi:MAG: N-carbamoyl-D-amino-acid hydrolase [Rhodospirillales bacterium]|jgi:N-carbamoyl-D-amino-acid hydrolase|nr:N-carbamoyl-D-amino-acid hydrolase [Rhodospirillales bacterium]
MRMVNVAAAQMGPIQRAESRAHVVKRLIALMHQAHDLGADLIVYPELALTTFFPRHYVTDADEINGWYETEMPNAATRPLFDLAREYKMAMYLGYAELTPEGKRFNTSIITDKTGAIVGKYRKVHLPGHADFDPERSFQHLEKYYFEPGDMGFPVWRTLGGIFGMCICNDRRWPETFRVLGLQGAEMVLLGYNTPSVNSQRASEGPAERNFQNDLVLQSAAYQNSTWVVATAKAGSEDGNHMIGGSAIVNPAGHIVAQAKTEDDEIVFHACDLDDTEFGKQTIFDFARHRRPEHYGRITGQTGVELPPENN